MTYKLHYNQVFELRRYRKMNGHVPVTEWLNQLDNATAARVQAHIDRMKAGNFGNSRQVGDGVAELKIDFGPGYRVYYVRDGLAVVVLLCGGDKTSQQKDIQQALEFATDYRRRK